MYVKDASDFNEADIFIFILLSMTFPTKHIKTQKIRKKSLSLIFISIPHTLHSSCKRYYEL